MLRWPSDFRGTRKAKEGLEAKRPASGANAHVGRSPGEANRSRSFICESVGPQRKTQEFEKRVDFVSYTPCIEKKLNFSL